MDYSAFDENTVRFVWLVVGAVPLGLSIHGLLTGQAYLPTRRAASQPPWVSRGQQPGLFWTLVVFQFIQGMVFACLPYLRR